MVLFHLVLVIITGAAVLYSDEQALAWFLGKKELLHPKHVQALHIIVTLGLAGIIVTGGLLFTASPAYYLADPTFFVKMLFVATLVVNGYFIDTFSHVPIGRSFASLSVKEKLPLLISGGVSILGWIGAALCGLILGGIL